MASLLDKIIRGAKVDAVVVCTPCETTDRGLAKSKHLDDIKKLEEFWRLKGYEEGLEEGFKKGFEEGQNKGQKAGSSQGFEYGVNEGEKRIKDSLGANLKLLDTLCSSLQEQKAVLYEEVKPELVRFACVVCERVLRRHLESQDVLTQMLKHIFEQARQIIKDAVVEVAVSAEDYELLQKSSQDLPTSQAKEIHLTIDYSLRRGDICVQTPLGLLNFDLERILADCMKKTLGVRIEE